MTSRPPITLASGSFIRAQILRGAGLDFEIAKPGVDEDEIKIAAAAESVDPEETAMRLASAKCEAIAVNRTGIVIGSDQILEFEGRLYDKPKTMDEARARLCELQGASHTLINAIAVARDGKIVWRHVDRPRLFVRPLSSEEIEAYLEEAGSDILSSVGAYQVEKLGARLFEKVEGDYYAVLGLSLYPLLGFLRQEGAIAF